MKTYTMAAALAASIAAPAWAQTVPNAGFESPSSIANGQFVDNPTVAGMTFNERSGVARQVFFTGSPPEGMQAGFIQNTAEAAGEIGILLSDLVAGSTYSTSFYLAMRPGYAANPLEVLFNGTALGVFAPTSSGFELFTAGDFVATGNSGTLSFVGTGPRSDSDTAIDLVQVTNLSPNDPGAVPEPATWAMMLVGFGGLGHAMRRKQKVSARIRLA